MHVASVSDLTLYICRSVLFSFISYFVATIDRLWNFLAALPVRRDRAIPVNEKYLSKRLVDINVHSYFKILLSIFPLKISLNSCQREM